MKNSRTRPSPNATLCFLLMLALCCGAQGQSGRRSAKPLSPPTAAETPAKPEEQTPVKDKPDAKAQTLIVGMNDQWGSTYLAPYMYDEAWRGFIEKFRSASSVILSTDKRMNRKEAIDRAKKETENFVVMLQLATDELNPMGTQNSLDSLALSYFIFTPATGKIKNQGRVYVRAYQRGVLSTPLPTGRTITSQLNQAGQEVAERVMTALDIGGPSITH